MPCADLDIHGNSFHVNGSLIKNRPRLYGKAVVKVLCFRFHTLIISSTFARVNTAISLPGGFQSLFCRLIDTTVLLFLHMRKDSFCRTTLNFVTLASGGPRNPSAASDIRKALLPLSRKDTERPTPPGASETHAAHTERVRGIRRHRLMEFKTKNRSTIFYTTIPYAPMRWMTPLHSRPTRRL